MNEHTETCPECGHDIIFEVETVADGHAENIATFKRHPGAEWFCPFNLPDGRDTDEFRELRAVAALNYVTGLGW